ncbi:hypothetical protein, partial [Bacteroides acidifaciens]|uniref:hypothetical protein n=1 Tax=Bacteroides acidifaciens TaxID=85831 RepID=UPI0023CECA0F
YTYHGEYIELLSSLKKLNALKALPPCHSLFSQGMFFFAFSRYHLLPRRLRIKLKRLKPDSSIKIQYESFG